MSPSSCALSMASIGPKWPTTWPTSATARLGWPAATSSSLRRSTTRRRRSPSCAPQRGRTPRLPGARSWHPTGLVRLGLPSCVTSAGPSPFRPVPSSSPATPAGAPHLPPPPWSSGTCRGPCRRRRRAVSSASAASSSPSSLVPLLLLTLFLFLTSLRLNGSPLPWMPAGMPGRPPRCLHGVRRTRRACGLPRRMHPRRQHVLRCR